MHGARAGDARMKRSLMIISPPKRRIISRKPRKSFFLTEDLEHETVKKIPYCDIDDAKIIREEKTFGADKIFLFCDYGKWDTAVARSGNVGCYTGRNLRGYSHSRREGESLIFLLLLFKKFVLIFYY